MKYEVRVAGQTFQVDLAGDVVRVGGRTMKVELIAIPGTPLVRLALDGVARTFAVARGSDRWEVQRKGRTFAVEVSDERTLSLRRMVGQRAHRSDGGRVRAPMPGLVVRLEVEEGQEVSAGTGLLVLEAMKMENEIRSTAAGVVSQILVAPGQKVDKGTELIVIAGSQG
jgi:pyruvate carboxylase subunit B